MSDSHAIRSIEGKIKLAERAVRAHQGQLASAVDKDQIRRSIKAARECLAELKKQKKDLQNEIAGNEAGN